MRCPRPASQAGLGRPGATVTPHYGGEPIVRLRRHWRTAEKSVGISVNRGCVLRARLQETRRCTTERSSSQKSRDGAPIGVARW